MKLTRHNGRSGKNGAYNPKHNDRRFDIGNSGHIDQERAKQNVYWDCYQGFHFPSDREQEDRIVYLAGHENSKITMDIYAKVKYNKPKELAAVVNGAFGQ